MQDSVLVTSFVRLQFILHDKNDHYVGYELLAALSQDISSLYLSVLFLTIVTLIIVAITCKLVLV